MIDKRAPAWWPTRILLSIGIALVALIAGAVCVLVLFPPMALGDEPVGLGPILIGRGALVAIAALAVAIVGLASMIRIFRGPRDEPPPWRYRDR